MMQMNYAGCIHVLLGYNLNISSHHYTRVILREVSYVLSIHAQYGSSTPCGISKRIVWCIRVVRLRCDFLERMILCGGKQDGVGQGWASWTSKYVIFGESKL